MQLLMLELVIVTNNFFYRCWFATKSLTSLLVLDKLIDHIQDKFSYILVNNTGLIDGRIIKPNSMTELWRKSLKTRDFKMNKRKYEIQFYL